MELNEIKDFFRQKDGLSNDTKSTDHNTYGYGKFDSIGNNRNSKGWIRAEYIVLEDGCIKNEDLITLKEKWNEACYVSVDGDKITAPYEPQYLIFNTENGWTVINSTGKEKKLANIEDLSSFVNERVSSVSLSSDAIDITKLLFERKNLILTGAPGTGKTYLARKIAAEIVGNCSYDGLSEEQRKQIGFVQFHPSYDYTDFVEGLRPDAQGNFARADGAFKEFCKEAIIHSAESAKDALRYFKEDVKSKGGIDIDYIDSKGSFKITVTDSDKLSIDTKSSKDNKQSATDADVIKAIETGEKDGQKTYPYCIGKYIKDRYFNHNYVFIIDEINRGELSKIFGELFYSIEPSYRGDKTRVRTQYNNMVLPNDIFKEGFFVPKNVYIIGTMNDIDRGVEAMDFAIRRRFAWREVTAEESADNMGITGIAKAKMKAINEALNKCGLNEAYHIGGAYFRLLKGDDYDSLWKYHLRGIIMEYFRGEPEAKDKLDAVEKAYAEAGNVPEDQTEENLAEISE